jgi:hypothetical protein
MDASLDIEGPARQAAYRRQYIMNDGLDRENGRLNGFFTFHGGNSPAQAHQNSGEAHELNRNPLNISIEMSDTRPCNTPATE